VTDDLTFATLDLDDESEEGTAQVSGWLEAVMRGFHQSSPTEEFRTRWLQSQRTDGAVIRGVWQAKDVPLASTVPVATFGHFVKTLNTGATVVPVWMITDVTVAPTHRRRGLMRQLMTENLDLAVAAGVPVAVLTASEGSIYQRFGFGPATREARVRVDTRQFRLRDRPSDGGRVAMMAAADAWPTLSAVFDRHHRETRGSVARPTFYEAWLRGYDWDEQSEDRQQRLTVHVDSEGQPDGFVAYAMKRKNDVGEVEVRDMVTASPAAHLALWQFFADIDLAEVATAPAPVIDPLQHALVDHRLRRVTSVDDHLWVRVLDLVAALEARPWFGEGGLTVRVLDGLGHADGTVRVEARGGRATVTPSSAQPDITLDVETLGALYLGDVPVDALARAARIDGAEDAVRRFAALADGSPSPYCNTHF
jgi:predicted acetyltransferase